jgi:glycerol-3-phosphate dehydrogenase
MDRDVVVIGAGIVGVSVARELIRRGLSVLVIEKEPDVGRGASGRNSGVLHPGFSVAVGSLKARLNVEGSRAMRPLCEELSVPLREVGTLVVGFEPSDLAALEAMRDAGRQNGLERLEIIGANDLARLEPEVTGFAALYSPEGAIVEPFLLVQRLATSALANGCEFMIGGEVTALARDAEGWTVMAAATGSGPSGASAEGRPATGADSAPPKAFDIRARVVVNAAGVGAPAISAMAGGETFDSFPCRGEYLILDKAATGVPGRMVYPVPPKSGGLGVHFTPTIEGNTLIGPSAEYVGDGEDWGTSAPVLRQLFAEASTLCPGVDPRDVISSMAGVRAKLAQGAYGSTDFVVEDSREAPGLVNLVGIESPGLSASPAIARMTADLVMERFPGREAYELVPLPPRDGRFAHSSDEDRARRAEADPGSRRVVCRCEQVTSSEVRAALEDPLAKPSMTSVKVRCRAGSGRCQGSFCSPRIIDMMRRELGMSATEITLKGPGSEILAGESKVLLS